ncbi:MAG: hypothetical protein Kow0077_14550 [Anaerolineae bacterium]
MFMSHVKRFTAIAILLLAAALLTLPALAQGGEVIVDGLNNPRGLSYAEDGTLYVAEAGTGGPQNALGPFDSEVTVGGTGRVTAVSPDGTVTAVVNALPSMNNRNNYGPQDAGMAGGLLWVVVGEGPESVPFNMSFFGLDPETGRVRHFVDLYTPEAEQNPDGDIIASQPVDFTVGPDGAVYIANAGCNCVMRWTEADGATIFASWPIDDNPVPTAVAFGPEGDLYVGFLSGFPFPEGGARIERWTLDGELVATFEGLTAVTGLLVADDGTIYAVEHGRFADRGWAPDSGRVVAVTADGITPIAEGLSRPYGIAQAADGSFAVSINSDGGEPGSGMVIRIGGM